MPKNLPKQNMGIPLVKEENLLTWDKVLIKFKETFGNDTYESWIKNINLKKEYNHYVILSAPTRFVRDWIVSRYADKILDIIKTFKKSIERIEFLIEETEEKSTTSDFNGKNNITLIENSISNYNRFNPNNRFDNFMVGESNELAYTAARKNGKADKLEPDSKSQVTMMYENGKPSKVTSVVISTQHSSKVNQAQVKEIVRPYLEKAIPKELLSELKDEEFYVNPTGQFIIGGPDGDSGLTGRKIIVDTYGGAAPHGGGAFSGKDPSKVDRSAAYAARYVAKNVVASKIADKCLIQLAYAIGVSKPLSIYVNLFDDDEEKSKHVEKLINDNFDLSPRGIREMLSLNKPIYECTAAYGHFGRKPRSNGSFSWEKTDKTSIFKK